MTNMSMGVHYTRITCPVCGKWVSLKSNGGTYSHKNPSGVACKDSKKV